MKKLILLAVFTCTISFMNAQTYQLSSHILDISTGNPAPNVVVKLLKLTPANQWVTLNQNTTDTNGRIINFLPNTNKDNKGTYKLVFETLPYFNSNNLESFYPFVEVVFIINDNKHYHVPITISPFGYATYKGN